MKSNWDRRTVLKTVGSTGALLAAGVGSAATKGKPEDTPGREGASGDENLVEKAISLNSSGPYEGEFDTLIDLVSSTPPVFDALTNPDDQLTVFAPVDAGFENTNLEGANVANVLQYHVTEGRRYKNSVVNAPRLEMLNGGTVTVDGTVLNGDQAEIIATNIEASNGVIHAIGPVEDENGVLVP